MDCAVIREAIIDVLEDAPAAVSDAEIRAHLDACAACREALPEAAAEWEAMNLAVAPPAANVDWESLARRTWADAHAISFPGLRTKLAAYQSRHARLAAAEDATPGSNLVVHHLEIEGEDLDVVCHMKGIAHLHLSIVDRKSRETSIRLDGARLCLPGGVDHEIHAGGVDVPLHEILRDVRFEIVKPDGTVLKLKEKREATEHAENTE